jgi:uncharacterized protein YcfL
MRKLLAIPSIFFGLLLLAGCSNAEAKACKDAQQAYADYVKPFDSRKSCIGLTFQVGRACENAHYKADLVIVNNPKCFKPEELVEAQINTRRS